MATCLAIVMWQCARRIEYLGERLPQLLPDRIARTSLFRQNWALYAPDATIDSRWIKLRALTGDSLTIDAWGGNPFTFDNAGVAVYQTEPWQNLAYRILYVPLRSEELARNWARYEFGRWERAHPGQSLEKLEVVAFERTILGPGLTTQTTWRVVAEERRQERTTAKGAGP